MGILYQTGGSSPWNRIVIPALLATMLAASGCLGAESDQQPQSIGYLEGHSLYILSDPDVPLIEMGIEMPKPRATNPEMDVTSVESNGFNVAGHNVQPSLTATFDSARLGVIHGFSQDWAVGARFPWKRTCVRGLIGGFAGTATVEAMGQPALFAKHIFLRASHGQRLVAMAGIELPTGLSDATFDESNAATDGYTTTLRAGCR